MALQLVQVNIKARDDAALGRFWAEGLRWDVASEGPGVTNLTPEGSVWPDPAAIGIDLVTVPDTDVVHDRAHFELATTSAAHHAELVARLEELGATRVAVDPARTVLADPEGNVFCVLQPLETHRDTGLIGAVVVDCADPRALAAFWGEALDWTVQELTDDRALLRSGKGVGPHLELTRSSHVAGLPHRVHLDLLPDPVDAKPLEVARLQGLGATLADVGQGDVPWRVMADPEGNEFCVLGRA